MRKILLSVFSVLMFVGTLFGQTELYVSQYKGDDTNNGTSWASSVATIEKAFEIIASNQGEYNVNIAQGYYIINAGLGYVGSGGNVVEILIKEGQHINLKGGYSTPNENWESVYNPKSFKVFLDSYDAYAAASNTKSVFRMQNTNENSDLSFKLKDLTIANARLGGDFAGAFLTIDDTKNAAFEMTNVDVRDWEGISGGFVAVDKSLNTSIKLDSLFVTRTANSFGTGQFLVTKNGGNTKNLDIVVDNSLFRNKQLNQEYGSLFYLDINSNNDQGQSSFIITNSQFLNNYNGANLAGIRSSAIITAYQWPLLKLDNNQFIGNVGGNAGVIRYEDSGWFISTNNLYQDNTGRNRGGAIAIIGKYAGTLPSASEFSDKDIYIDGDTYINNKATSGRGGAVFIDNSTLASAQADRKVQILNSEFQNNQSSGATNGGGAIYLNTSQTATVENSAFCSNSSNNHRGGAINVLGSGELVVENSSFTSNTADTSGGAIYSEKATNDFTNSSFESNIATFEGGAIYSENAIELTQVSFTNNEAKIQGAASEGGGAISSDGDLTASFTLFQGNTSNADGGIYEGDGGAIYVGNSKSATISDSKFIENTSTRAGGALRISRDVTLTRVEFTSNTTGSDGGGAVYSGGNVSATDALFATNTSGGQGGAIKASGNLEITTTKLNGNEASNQGGAVYIGGIVTANHADFNKNISASQGGAIRASGNITINNSRLNENKANGGDGGAVWGSSNITADSSLFESNISSNDGGAIYIDGGSLLLTNSVLKSNSSAREGGAIKTQNANISTYSVDNFTSEVIFDGNQSPSGGAIYAYSAPSVKKVYNLKFAKYIYNTASDKGGALYINDMNGGTKNIDNNIFSQNSAASQGGAIAVFGGGTGYGGSRSEIESINNNTFHKNTANGSTTIIPWDGGSDIYLKHGSNNYHAVVDSFINNLLQTDPSNYASTNYLLVGTSSGFINDTSNPNTLISATFEPDLTYTNTNPNTPAAPGQIDINPITCEQIPPVALSPIILSSGGAAYSAFSNVVSDEDCNPAESTVLFTARTNAADGVATPINELKFYYTRTVINNTTGEVIAGESNLTGTATVFNGAPNVTRVVDVVDTELTGLEAGAASGLPRTLYNLYYLDVTNEIEQGRTYVYEIVKIEETAADGTVEYTYPEANGISYATTLRLQDCGECTVEPGFNAPAITHVGISTLNRNAENWLTNEDNNRLGAYLALESSEKGFVLPRLTTEQINTNLGTTEGVEEGMLVWDITANCLKMLVEEGDGLAWKCLKNKCAQ
ncbi:hypothetical protein NMK71_03470 [Weeksellaceae bacterium KMM 9713]|uniref:Polymorphic outer membrane protein repeat-containing protein n=1 Tax=Profundicola chukchiensis TaxID=2961959 RepID=A0A9X4RTV8_9FLAO|nr:hypothetical protein [Profundicola chukchiensis]MDG4945463.1 hypothetical protein [Profundicola chukchiensis]